MKTLANYIVTLLLSAAGSSSGLAQPASGAFTADAAGRVSMVQSPGGSVLGSLVAATHLDGCHAVGNTQRTQGANGGSEYRRTLRHDEKRQCLLIERFTPTEHGMRWSIEILGEGDPWSTAIQTRLKWDNADGLTWWTAWGDSRSDAPMGIRDGAPLGAVWWTDPLVPVPFAEARYDYGGRSYRQPQAFCIPLVTVLDAKSDRAISLVLSPEDVMFDVTVDVSTEGGITISRASNRISENRPVGFSMDLVCHEADWRSGLGWMADRYPAYFNPPNSNVHKLAGCGAYSSHARDFDADRLRRMAFQVNWKASFDFPYMGMFVPPVPDDTTEWVDFKSKPNSIRRMRDDIREFTDKGFHVLNYFNVTEFGNHIKYPPPPRKAERDADLWKDANDFTYHVLGDAILTLRGEKKPIYSWEDCIAMDPGEPTYQNHLVEQARRHVELFPQSSGICIDRMDWLSFFNFDFDDGLSWVDGRPARSLVTSWHEVIGRIGGIMHAHDKVIYCNPHYRRLDLLKHIDGVYDEFGQMGHSMNLCALLALRKPVMAWTIMTPELEHAPDAYFQRHLHMGAHLTAPIPGNDHTILPSADVDALYFDYGPMLDAMRGKRWVLKPHAVEVADRTAKANLFEVPGGYVVPVTFGGRNKQARVMLRHLREPPGRQAYRCEVIHPGETVWTSLSAVDQNGIVTLDVPLKRGCAMVKLSPIALTPASP